jgi:putative ABC transport system substrate-binding protein
MRRRDFIVRLGGATVAWPLAVRAQQTARMRRIGVLMTNAESDPEGQARVTAFLTGLRELGWSEGRNLRVEYRWYEGNTARAEAYAVELARLTPDLLLANGTPALSALKNETRTVPIVFVMVPDPLGAGFVSSQAHPGGNITGFTQFDYPIAGKWLQILKEIAPAITRVAVLFNPDEFQSSGLMRVIIAAALLLEVELIPIPVHDAVEIERGIDAFAPQPKGGLLVITSPLTTVHRQLIVTLADRHRLPAIYPYRFFAVIGGLVSYGVDNIDLFRQAASYVDRILRGEASVGDLPVQEPTRYETVLNLKTAKALGLAVPRSILLRADELIE